MFISIWTKPPCSSIRKAVNEGKIQRYQQGEIPVFIGLETEEGYPHQGTINFVNNQINSGTGSITVRGVMANPKPPGGVRLLSPGMFVRVRLPIGKPHDAILVIDRAIGSDQGLKFLYVLDDKNTVQQRRVVTGPLEEDGLRVIEDGIKADDWVVVGGIQQVRPGMKIVPDREPMPTLGVVTTTLTPGADTAGPEQTPSEKANEKKSGASEEDKSSKSTDKGAENPKSSAQTPASEKSPASSAPTESGSTTGGAENTKSSPPPDAGKSNPAPAGSEPSGPTVPTLPREPNG